MFIATCSPCKYTYDKIMYYWQKKTHIYIYTHLPIDVYMCVHKYIYSVYTVYTNTLLLSLVSLP